MQVPEIQALPFRLVHVSVHSDSLENERKFISNRLNFMDLKTLLYFLHLFLDLLAIFWIPFELLSPQINIETIKVNNFFLLGLNLLGYKLEQVEYIEFHPSHNLFLALLAFLSRLIAVSFSLSALFQMVVHFGKIGHQEHEYQIEKSKRIVLAPQPQIPKKQKPKLPSIRSPIKLNSPKMFPQILRSTQSVISLNFKHIFEYIKQVRVHFPKVDCKLFLRYSRNDIGYFLSFDHLFQLLVEGQSAECQPECVDAQGPDIGLAVVVSAVELWGSGHYVADVHGQFFAFLGDTGQAQITDFEMAAVQQDIFRFQVSMDDVFRLEQGECIENIVEQNIGKAVTASRGPIDAHSLESISFTPFENQVNVGLGGPIAIKKWKIEQMGFRRQCKIGLYLAFQPLLLFLRHGLRVHNLYGVALKGFGVVSIVDTALAAPPNAVLHLYFRGVQDSNAWVFFFYIHEKCRFLSEK